MILVTAINVLIQMVFNLICKLQEFQGLYKLTFISSLQKLYRYR